MEKKIDEMIPMNSRGISRVVFACISLCILGMVVATASFVINQYQFPQPVASFTDWRIIINNPVPNATYSPDDMKQIREIQEVNQRQIDQSTNLIQIHQSASSGNIMSFLYTFISTILLVVAIYFVRNIQQKHHDMAIQCDTTSERIVEQESKFLAMQKQLRDEATHASHIQELDYLTLMLNTLYQDPSNYILVFDYATKIVDNLSILSKEIHDNYFLSKDTIVQTHAGLAWTTQRIEALLRSETDNVEIFHLIIRKANDICSEIKTLKTDDYSQYCTSNDSLSY